MPKLVKPVDTNLNNTEMDDTASVQVKVPKRILHFCDGTLEEYSDDELEQADVKQPEPVVDPVSSYSHHQMAHNTLTETAIDSTLGVSCTSNFYITQKRNMYLLFRKLCHGVHGQPTWPGQLEVLH